MEQFIPVKNKLRVCHNPQVGSGAKTFRVNVKDEQEALKIAKVLADQHLHLFENRVIGDYANTIYVEMYDEEINDEDGKSYGWGNYWNDEMCMEWDGVEEYFESNSN